MHGPCDIHPETFWGQLATEQQKTTTTTTTVGETLSVSPVQLILEMKIIVLLGVSLGCAQLIPTCLTRCRNICTYDSLA